MDFFGIGIMEVLVTLVVAMLVLGPEQLPTAAHKLGSMLQEARKSVSETRDSILQDLTLNDDAKAKPTPEEHGHSPVEHRRV